MQISKKNVAQFFIAVYLLFSFGNYFDVIYGPRFSYFVLIPAFWGISQLNLGRSKYNIFLILFTSLLVILFTLPNNMGIIALPKYTILIPFLFAIQLEDLLAIYKKFITLYIISVFPALLVLLSYVFGNENIFSPRLFTESYRPFLVFWGTVVQPGEIIDFERFRFMRISGIQGEPGGLAMVAFLILIVENLNFKPWYNKTVLFFGLMSFSLAFYLLLGLFLIAKTLTVKSIKEAIPIIIIIIAFFYIAQNSILVDKFIVDRLAQSKIEEEQIGHYRRTIVSGPEFFHYYFDQPINFILFGRGPEYAGVQGSNYMALLYNWGLLTTVLQILLLFLLFKYSETGLIGFSIPILIIVSIYQRPYIFNTGTIFLLFLASINYKCYKRTGFSFENYYSLKKDKSQQSND